MQKPSVGRVVHYRFEGNACAAIITFVHSDTCVNLAWFTPNGYLGHGKTSVLFDADGAQEDTWSWPPRV